MIATGKNHDICKCVLFFRLRLDIAVSSLCHTAELFFCGFVGNGCGDGLHYHIGEEVRDRQCNVDCKQANNKCIANEPCANIYGSVGMIYARLFLMVPLASGDTLVGIKGRV